MRALRRPHRRVDGLPRRQDARLPPGLPGPLSGAGGAGGSGGREPFGLLRSPALVRRFGGRGVDPALSSFRRLNEIGGRHLRFIRFSLVYDDDYDVCMNGEHRKMSPQFSLAWAARYSVGLNSLRENNTYLVL